ncbi:unnamed protein product [Adineta steineri]|uniref:Uncharacterized protein n=1 Tax=Adineta steineri TaxID=433720 RepID=A0A815SEJ5_9BILA|nr:unnamed protein product [Adineta steineri]CAF4341680.1 unnamed protein product [Adineta steineri]
MRYTLNRFDSCYNTRQDCSILRVNQIPEGCSCRYLPLTKIRRCDTLEDYSFSLISVTNHTRAIQAFDFYNLRNYVITFWFATSSRAQGL